MQIKNNTIYHLPTEELKHDFLTQANKQGVRWSSTKNAFAVTIPNRYGDELCISVFNEWNMEYSPKSFYEKTEGYKHLPIIKWESNKAKPTIINLSNCKIVINKPYIIVTDGKHTGKAKCNPEDEWSVEKGMELAVNRYKTEIQKHPLSHAVAPKRTMWVPRATIQERFPIGSKVEMFRKSGKPRTAFEIGEVTTVVGHVVRGEDDSRVVCAYGIGGQRINPDDLRVVK